MNLDYFINNPFIQTIADNERWTISTKKKMPIDMNCLRKEGRIVGAAFKNGNKPLVDLYALQTIVPNAANAAYRMNQNLDDFVVLDIEPKCPNELKEKLLKLPYVYGELSLSGKGFHLVLPTPLTKYRDILLTKPAIKEENGYYEILLSHYVTFTGNMITPSKACVTEDIGEFYKIFDEIARTKKVTANIEMETSDIPQVEQIPYGKDIVELLKKAKYEKSLADFKGEDNSAYEFGVIGFYYKRLKMLLSTTKYRKYDYTLQEQLRLLYTVVISVIPQRAKHAEKRGGLPMLMYSCKRALTRLEAE